jgi:hypothetical protein
MDGAESLNGGFPTYVVNTRIIARYPAPAQFLPRVGVDAVPRPRVILGGDSSFY